MTSILDKLKSGEPARLFPVVSESKREERATATMLAVMSMVPKFSEAILSQAGAKFGKRTIVKCYTEVIFSDNPKLRPDGLIVVQNGKNEWSALIEAKVGSANLKQEQVEDYMRLCRDTGADALITVSNQFALRPHHHPLLIPRRQQKYVTVGHFSWLSIISEALILIEQQWVEDIEQAYLLRELIRYLEHKSSGVSSHVRMGQGWKETVAAFQAGTKLPKSSPYLREAVASWHQVLRLLTVSLTMKTGTLVTLSLNRARQRDPDLNFQKDLDHLSKTNELEAELELADMPAKLKITANFTRRSIDLSYRLNVPDDSKRATSIVNWFSKQLGEVRAFEPIVRAYWPRRANPTYGKLTDIAAGQLDTIVPDSFRKDKPTAIEITWIVDLGSRFKGNTTFVDDAMGALPLFYSKVVKDLRVWKVKQKKPPEKTQQPLPLEEKTETATEEAPTVRPAPPPDVFRILPVRETRYLNEEFNT